MNYGSNSIATDRPQPRFRALLPKARLRYAGLKRGRSSVVERQLPKLYVEGSIPFARSNFLRETGGNWASIVRREINCSTEKIAFFGFVLPNCGFCSYNLSAWHSAGNGNAASIHS